MALCASSRCRESLREAIAIPDDHLHLKPEMRTQSAVGIAPIRNIASTIIDLIIIYILFNHLQGHVIIPCMVY